MGRVRLGEVSAVLAALAAGCGATAGGPGDDQSGGPDAPRADARIVVDAPALPDARPCVEGDMHVVDPTTGTCYTAHTMARVPWADARAQCQAIGSDLAVIRSAADNQLLTTLLGANEAFLGGNDLTTEGTFLWVDGSPVTYSNWRINTPPALNEPNNGSGNYQEDCIVLQGQLAGVWDDRPCDSTEVTPPAGTHFFLCAR